jgi:inorganic pyrophosphatase
VLIANDMPLIAGSVINCTPIGVLFMTDEAGTDEKIIAVPSGSVSKMYGSYNSINDLPEMKRRQIAHFFQHYKDLEDGKWVKIDRWGDAAEARGTYVVASAFLRFLRFCVLRY